MNTSKSKKMKPFGIMLLASVLVVSLTAFSTLELSSFDAGPEAWANYKSWTKVTRTPNTGDPTGFLDKKHGGVKAYRDVYVNEVGISAYQSQQFPLPEGTVIVKEAFKNKGAYDAQKNPELTIMVKLAEDSNPDTGNWQWFMGGDGKKMGTGMDTKWGKFCASCHAYGQAADFTFMSTLK